MRTPGTLALLALLALAGCGGQLGSYNGSTDDGGGKLPGSDARAAAADRGATDPDADNALVSPDGSDGLDWAAALDGAPTAPDAGAAGDLGAAPDLPTGGSPGTVIADDPKQARSWPAAHGEALITLWQDDKLASMAITIDDNTAPDHPWWVAQGKTFGMRFTWFVITGKVGTSPYQGSWSGFASLVADGHDVQSHTVWHLSKGLPIDQEYRDSQKAIEANIPAVRALTLAYPGGTNSALNDPQVAAKYYIGARGTVGKDNPVTSINYMRTNSISGKFILLTDHWAGIPNLITFNPAHPTSFRAFHCIHYHQVSDKVAALAGLTYIDDHAADIWLGLFREVIQYGREREAATLQVPQVTADAIVLTLSDTLDDGTFDYPLTLKVGLAGHWTGATATQGGSPTPVQVITHGGKPFALLRAVPDRGPVLLSRQ